MAPGCVTTRCNSWLFRLVAPCQAPPGTHPGRRPTAVSTLKCAGGYGNEPCGPANRALRSSARSGWMPTPVSKPSTVGSKGARRATPRTSVVPPPIIRCWPSAPTPRDVLADFLRSYGKHPPLPLRKSAHTYAYRGLPACASLSLAGSDRRCY